MRIAIAEDSGLFRHALADMLERMGEVIVASTPDARGLLTLLPNARPDVVLLDIRMPPTWTLEGLDAAGEIKQVSPEVGVVLLSTFREARFARELLKAYPRGLGYLLKDRVDDAHSLITAVRRVADGGTAIDPDFVGELFSDSSADSPIATLSPRRHRVLELMAEGLSNSGIARKMNIDKGTVETHVSAVFAALKLPYDEDENRRVRAVLAWLDRDKKFR